jgi:hypothetical protein
MTAAMTATNEGGPTKAVEYSECSAVGTRMNSSLAIVSLIISRQITHSMHHLTGDTRSVGFAPSSTYPCAASGPFEYQELPASHRFRYLLQLSEQ